MLRSINTLCSSLKSSGLHVSNHLKFTPVCIQSVRWKRKPRWLPVAKSKQFRVPERPTYDESERTELRRLYDRYRTHLRAVRCV
jgi:hypothetical protein